MVIRRHMQVITWNITLKYLPLRWIIIPATVAEQYKHTGITTYFQNLCSHIYSP